MNFGVAKALVLLQLSLLFVGSFTAEVDGLISALPPDSLHPHHPPIYPPTQPPSHSQSPPPKPAPPVHPPKPAPPVHPPTPAPGPAHPPTHPFPWGIVAVEGVVYCKSCKHPGFDTLLDASPIVGALVKLVCNDTKNPQVTEAKTDEHGYFFLQAPQPKTMLGAEMCKVFLESSPLPKCSKPSPLNGGVSGAELKFEVVFPGWNEFPYFLYKVGPFAYEPKCH